MAGAQNNCKSDACETFSFGFVSSARQVTVLLVACPLYTECNQEPTIYLLEVSACLTARIATF